MHLTITLVGDSFVGKTTLLNLLRKRTSDKYQPTIFENTYHFITVNNTKYELHISDTSGSPEYTELREKVYTQTDLFLVCFAVDNITSLEKITSYWLPNFPDKPKIILGLKNDIRYQQNNNSSQKIIQFKEGTEVAGKYNLPYLEYGFIADNTLTQNTLDIEEILKKGIEIMNDTNKSKDENKNIKKRCRIM